MSKEKRKTTLRFTQEELYDRVSGGWVGQMAGVAWGTPTEFCYASEIIPDERVPKWTPEMINTAFTQDDIYAEIPFIDAMAENGFDCSLEPLAENFKNTRFALWHANGLARENLRRGIPAPESGAYYNNCHSEDIDWQIECDFLGMIYPGNVKEASRRAFEIGHIMNYGDGVYGGVFVSALHAASFTAKSVKELCGTAVSVIPKGTQFRALLDDVTAWYEEGRSFSECWRLLEEKWNKNKVCPELPGQSNIDAKFNSGYVLMGLLYGGGDFEKSVYLSLVCGQDSDCNPSTVGAVLGNYLGEKGIPLPFTGALDKTGKKFSFTDYTYENAVNLNCSLMEEQLKASGARFEDGAWIFEIEDPEPVPFEQMPDGVYAQLLYHFDGAGISFKELTPYAKNDRALGYTVDFGDGSVFESVLPARYTYAAPGVYRFSVTVHGEKSENVIANEEFTVREAPETVENEILICPVLSPFGGGSRDISIIRNGVIPSPAEANDKLQYDTYILGDPHGNPPRAQYIGAVFRSAREVKGLSFTEGNHFSNGGWFASGTLKLQVLKDKEWKDAECVVCPAYPKGNRREDFLPGYETYVFTLSRPTLCDGVRLWGTGGGSAGFISVCEFDVL